MRPIAFMADQEPQKIIPTQHIPLKIRPRPDFYLRGPNPLLKVIKTPNVTSFTTTIPYRLKLCFVFCRTMFFPEGFALQIWKKSFLPPLWRAANLSLFQDRAFYCMVSVS